MALCPDDKVSTKVQVDTRVKELNHSADMARNHHSLVDQDHGPAVLVVVAVERQHGKMATHPHVLSLRRVNAGMEISANSLISTKRVQTPDIPTSSED